MCVRQRLIFYRPLLRRPRRARGLRAALVVPVRSANPPRPAAPTIPGRMRGLLGKAAQVGGDAGIQACPSARRGSRARARGWGCGGGGTMAHGDGRRRSRECAAQAGATVCACDELKPLRARHAIRRAYSSARRPNSHEMPQGGPSRPDRARARARPCCSFGAVRRIRPARRAASLRVSRGAHAIARNRAQQLQRLHSSTACRRVDRRLCGRARRAISCPCSLAVATLRLAARFAPSLQTAQRPCETIRPAARAN